MIATRVLRQLALMLVVTAESNSDPARAEKTC
jgi:hypothetical protein